MWIAKFKVWHETCKLRPKCEKYNITDLVYVLKSWKEQEKFYYTQFHILQGNDTNKNRFVRALRKDKDVKKIEYKNSCVFTLREDVREEFIDPAFNPRIIQVKPVIQRTDGFEDWELASWDKNALMKIFDIPAYKVEIISITKTSLTDIMIPHIYPKITEKQREAIELAVREGYYNFPRHIDLVGLAKKSNLTRPSFQERLRKAEKKLVPFLTENLPARTPETTGTTNRLG